MPRMTVKTPYSAIYPPMSHISASKPIAEAQTKPIEDKSVGEFAAALEGWRKKVDAFEKTVADETASDDDLREIPEQIDVLQRHIVDRKALLKPKLEEVRARLAKLGPAPKENAPKESPETAALARPSFFIRLKLLYFLTLPFYVRTTP